MRQQASCLSWIVGFTFVAQLALAGFARAEEARRQDAPTKPTGWRQILATFPAPSYAYEISVAVPPRCDPKKWGRLGDKARCPFEIRLLQRAKTLATTQFPIASCGEVRPRNLYRILGADLEAPVWVTAFGSCLGAIGARAVELAPGITGLLVTVRVGFEHPTRTHLLFLGDENEPAKGQTRHQGMPRLRTVWTESEGGAPTSLTTRVLPTGAPHVDDVALIESNVPPLEAAQTVAATRLHLEPSTGEIVKSALPDAQTSLFLLKIGSFATAEQAYEARGKANCLAPFQAFTPAVVPGLPVPRAPPAPNEKGFFLGMVLARREDAAVPFGDPDKCAGDPTPTVVELSAQKK